MSTNYNIERNSFLYGELNTQVKKNNYSGLETATTVTHVDNASNTIYVDAKIDIETLEKEIEAVNEEYKKFKIESEEIRQQIIEVKAQLQATKEEIEADIQPKLEAINIKINEIKQEIEMKIDSLGLVNINGMLCVIFEEEEDIV